MTSTEPLEEQYFVWLYNKFVGFNEDEPVTHYSLCSQLQHIPYRWSVPNDDNRAADGKFLREKFLSETHDLRGEPSDFLTQECSVLEFLIGVSIRAEFESMESQMWWFWEMLHNLGVVYHNDDRFTAHSANVIDRVVDRLLDRTFNYDGSGGLFPLQDPPMDQREAEVWYQMSTYILEH